MQNLLFTLLVTGTLSLTANAVNKPPLIPPPGNEYQFRDYLENTDPKMVSIYPGEHIHFSSLEELNMTIKDLFNIEWRRQRNLWIPEYGPGGDSPRESEGPMARGHDDVKFAPLRAELQENSRFNSWLNGDISNRVTNPFCFQQPHQTNYRGTIGGAYLCYDYLILAKGATCRAIKEFDPPMRYCTGEYYGFNTTVRGTPSPPLHTWKVGHLSAAYAMQWILNSCALECHEATCPIGGLNPAFWDGRVNIWVSGEYGTFENPDQCEELDEACR